MQQEMSRQGRRAPVDSDAMIRTVLAVLAGITALTVCVVRDRGSGRSVDDATLPACAAESRGDQPECGGDCFPVCLHSFVRGRGRVRDGLDRETFARASCRDHGRYARGSDRVGDDVDRKGSAAAKLDWRTGADHTGSVARRASSRQASWERPLVSTAFPVSCRMTHEPTVIKRTAERKGARNQPRIEPAFKRMQPLLAHTAAHLDDDLSLAMLAEKSGLSAFYLQRIFSATVGETPKQLALRLRLARAAVMLLADDESILNVALACGFQSHENFIRGFRRRFGMTPSAYRSRGFRDRVSAAEAENHAALVAQVSPCAGLYHIGERQNFGKNERTEMAYAIAKKQISPQPALVVRRRIKPADLAKTLGETLPHVVMYAQRGGLALAGQPFTRYIEWGPGLWTIEAGMPVTALSKETSLMASVPNAPGGEIQIKEDTLPGGFAAAMTYAGPYEGLGTAHAEIQQWIEKQGLVAGGAPWEVYVTDPADYPDPKDWKTDLFWPLAP
jgi:AraC family transcriptional regulator